MTEQNEQELEVMETPLIAVAIANEDDTVLSFPRLAENTSFEAATISDEDLIGLVANWMDTTPDELERRVYGNERGGKLVVSRPNTGNIVVRPATVLG